MEQKIVRWIHVSDWHVTDPPSRDITEILDALIKDIKARVTPNKKPRHAFKPDFVVHSGDLARSGQETEYRHALGHLTQVVEAANISPDQLFIVPGNHDVDDSQALSASSLESAHDEASYKAAGEEFYESHARCATLLKRFTHFQGVLSSLIPTDNLLTPERAYYVCRFRASCGVEVGIAGLNSALISRKDDEKANRRMVVGRWQVSDCKRDTRQLNECDLRIALLHHPFSRLSEYDEEQTRNEIAGFFHCTLRGHLHRNAARVELSTEPPLVTIASGAGYEAAGSPKGYVLVELNMSRPRLTLHFQRWVDSLRKFVPDTGALKNVGADGTWGTPLPRAMFATDHPGRTAGAFTPATGPERTSGRPPISLKNRLGVPIPPDLG